MTGHLLPGTGSDDLPAVTPATEEDLADPQRGIVGTRNRGHALPDRNVVEDLQDVAEAVHTDIHDLEVSDALEVSLTVSDRASVRLKNQGRRGNVDV